LFRLEGIMSPMVTPFTRDEQIDEDALRKETRFLADAGVHGLTVCGSTGEGYAMRSEEIGRVTSIVRDEAGSQTPIITGIIADSAKIAIDLGMAAKKSGADGLMVTPVHYVFSPTSEGTVEYYRRIGETIGLPIVIYNVIPWNVISVDLVVRLMEMEKIRGIKQSGGDIHVLADMIRAIGDRIPVMTAIDDMLFPSFIIGASGAIAAICTIAPNLCLEVWEAAKDRDLKKGIEIHHRILPVWRAIGKGDMPARAKEALRQLGRHVGPARNPMISVSDQARKEIHDALLEAKLLT